MDNEDPHGGMTCSENEAWADDMCDQINAVTHLLARRGYVRPKSDDDLFDDVFRVLEIAALTGRVRPLRWPVPEEWFA
jgi:hypothetical protein